MIAKESKPRLSPKARLRFDRHAGQHMLVYPEKGLQLNSTAAAIAALCTGEHSVSAIVEQLGALHPGAPREQIEREVHEFLQQLQQRGLLRDAGEDR